MESHLRYVNVIWGSIPSSKIKILQNLQDRARTIIERARIKDDWSYNWLNVEQLIKFDRSTMTYNIMNRMCPERLWDKFPQISLHSNYNTRNCKDIHIPRYNLEYVTKGVLFIQFLLHGTASPSVSENCQPSRSSKEI